MSISRRIKEYLDKNGIKVEVVEHEPAYTSQQTAAAAHMSGNDLAKVVMAKTGGDYVMCVVPASRMVDLEALQAALGSQEPVELAHEREFQHLFPDCELGAEPPFGNLYDIPVIVDEALAAETEIGFNAGNHHELIKMKYQDYESLVLPRRAVISNRFF